MNIMIEFDDFTGKSWLPLLIVWIRSKCWYLVTIHDGRCITTSLPKFGEKSWSPSQVFSNWSPNGRMTLNGFFKLPHPDDIGQIGETWWNLALATQFGHPVLATQVSVVESDCGGSTMMGSTSEFDARVGISVEPPIQPGWRRQVDIDTREICIQGCLEFLFLKIFQGLNFINDTQRGSQRGCLCDYLEKAGMFFGGRPAGCNILSLGFLWTTSQTRNAKESSGVRLPEETWGNTGCKYCLLSFVFFAANVPSILGRSPFLWPTWRKRWT